MRAVQRDNLRKKDASLCWGADMGALIPPRNLGSVVSLIVEDWLQRLTKPTNGVSSTGDLQWSAC